MSGSGRDAGLVRSVGPVGLAANIVSILIGAGIFVVPAAMAASMGVYAPVAFLVCGVAVGAVAICFAEGGSRIPTSGGVYGYITEAFGPLIGYVMGVTLLLTDVLSCGGVAAALGDSAASVAPGTWRSAVRVAVILSVVGGVAVLNVGGVARGTRLVKATTLIKLLPLGIFVVVGMAVMHRANFVQTVHPGAAGLGRAFILAVFALTGMEASVSVSGEVREPSRTIPRALLMALLPVTVLYVLIQVAAQGVLGGALAQSRVPLAEAMGRVSPGLRVLMLVGTALSMFGWVSSDIVASPRIVFAFARDGLLPGVLGKLHPRNHTPYPAIVCYAAVAVVLALTGSFEELAVLATLGAAMLYIAGCAAAWRLKREGVARAGQPLSFRWLSAAAGLGIVSMAAMIALGSRAEILGLVAVIGVSAAVYLVQTRLVRRRQSGAVGK